MCLIVDANRASVVFGRPEDPDSLPIWRWLLGEGRLVFGAKLSKELRHVDAARRLLAELVRAGKAAEASREEVTAEEATLIGKLRSDDPHVLALARVTGARLLHTLDRDLIKDFRDPHLLSNPRGKVYQRREHEHLLIRANCSTQN